jgi:hypothetical protein
VSWGLGSTGTGLVCLFSFLLRSSGSRAELETNQQPMQQPACVL